MTADNFCPDCGSELVINEHTIPGREPYIVRLEICFGRCRDEEGEIPHMTMINCLGEPIGVIKRSTRRSVRG